MSLEEGVPIKCVYGYIEDVLSPEGQEEEYYIVRVSREDSLQPQDTGYPVIPLEQTIEELSSLYGPPTTLIGRRVRVEYTGRSFVSGVARIVADIVPSGGTEMNEMRSRGFRYAVPGQGGGLGGIGL